MNDTLRDIDDMVDQDALVTIREIADMGDADEATARGWTEQDSFPEPVATPETGALWARGQVDKWLMEHGEDEYQPPVV